MTDKTKNFLAATTAGAMVSLCASSFIVWVSGSPWTLPIACAAFVSAFVVGVTVATCDACRTGGVCTAFQW